MKPDSHAVFEPANELGVGSHPGRGEMTGSRFAIHRQQLT
jgi:hypothetical protein